MAGPGVTFLGHVSEEEKRERLGRAHALVATSVREGWGLVVTEAAASGTVAIGYDVPACGTRSERREASSRGPIRHPWPPAWPGCSRQSSRADGPRAEPAGVVPWAEVAAAILAVARGDAIARHGTGGSDGRQPRGVPLRHR